MSQFQIVELFKDGRVVPCPQYGVFETGKEAQAFIAANPIMFEGRKMQPRPVQKDDNWRAREQRRLEDGTYKPLKWTVDQLPPIKDHFAHADPDYAGYVSFTENEEKGRADIRSRRSISSYLSTFYPHLNPYRRRLLELIQNENLPEGVELKFATTEKDILWVYRHGPSSCMSNPRSDYGTAYHPVCSYAAGDLAIAYFEDEDGDVAARAITWPDKKIYGRVYGDGTTNMTILEYILQQHGYVYSKTQFEGARLLARWDDDVYDEEDDTYLCGYIVPYLDIVPTLRKFGDFLVLDYRGDIAGQNARGLAEDDLYMSQCECCGNQVGEYYALRLGNAIKCIPCAIADGECCAVSGEYVDNHGHRLADGRIISQAYVDTHLTPDGRLVWDTPEQEERKAA